MVAACGFGRSRQQVGNGVGVGSRRLRQRTAAPYAGGGRTRRRRCSRQPAFAPSRQQLGDGAILRRRRRQDPEAAAPGDGGTQAAAAACLAVVEVVAVRVSTLTAALLYGPGEVVGGGARLGRIGSPGPGCGLLPPAGCSRAGRCALGQKPFILIFCFISNL